MNRHGAALEDRRLQRWRRREPRRRKCDRHRA